MTYSHLRRFTSTNAASVIDGNLWLVLKPWSGKNHNKREWLERHLVLHARMTSNPVLQAIKQKYALHRNMKYSIREICLFLKALKQNSQFQGRMTWFILRIGKIVVRYALKMFLIRARWFPRVKIRIQIPMILKTIDTPKKVSQHLERFNFKSCRN